MKKTNIYVLAFLAIACVALAIFVVMWTRKIDKIMDWELNPVVVEPVEEPVQEQEIPVNNDTVDALQ